MSAEELPLPEGIERLTCIDCGAQLVTHQPGRIEHRDDGAHEFVPGVAELSRYTGSIDGLRALVRGERR